MSEVRDTIKRLTKPQRQVVLAIGDAPVLPGRFTFSATAAFNLIRVGVTKIVFDRELVRERYALTPLGLKVRDALTNSEGGGE